MTVSHDEIQSTNSIIFDCLNIKRGGGVTVALRIIRGFLDSGWTVHVLLASAEVAKILAEYKDSMLTVHNKPELSNVLRGLVFRHTKFDRFAKSLGCSRVFSFNYWSPTNLTQVTYHINVIPFLSRKERFSSIGMIRGVIQPIYSRWALSKSAVNLFESKHILDLARSSYSSAINSPKVKYIGIDIPAGIEPSAEPQPNIITVTSGAAHKRNDLTIELHRKLSSVGLKVGLVIGGFGKELAIRGSLSEDDNKYIDEHDDIRFLGYCTREELYTELSNATVLVSFSELESFFMVPVEAMIVGCPTITTNVSSIAESVGEAGIVVEPGDVAAVQSWVEKLLHKKERELWSQRALNWAKEFDGDKCVEQIVSETEKAA